VRDSLPTPVAVDGAQLWKWVRYYINNWRVQGYQTNQVLAALSQSYWQGVISWNELIRCERLLGTTSLDAIDGYEATDLTVALSHIGRMIQGVYKITDIRGFVDQGIVLQAQKGEQSVTLLCVTVDTQTSPQTDHYASPFIVQVAAVIKTQQYTYLELSPLAGQPLCAWLMARYPTGLPARLANVLLQQIYQLLLQLRTSEAVSSIHPGQLFIEPESLTLQLIPCAAEIQPFMRGHLYQVYEEDEHSKTALGHRLVAIAYELFTGCVPYQHYQMHAVLKECKELQNGQKQQIERCLSGKRSLTLSQAALLLDASKKYVTRDTVLLALASVFALAAFTWQGMHYVPLWLTDNTAVDTPVVLQQGTRDRHVNLLKAAFFTQIEEGNFTGAQVSWQALQKILPQDDIFIAKIGPELLAQQNETIEIVTREIDIVPITAPVAPPAPEEMMSMPVIPDDIAALPPLPETTQALEQVIEAVIIADPCESALAREGNARSAACMDALSNAQFGPRLLATKSEQNKPLIITQQTISVADYNQYCVMSSNCKPHEVSVSLDLDLDLELNEIENTVEDYNTYCLTSGLCEPLDTQSEPMYVLTPKQIETYSAWLSEETGFVYRLPKVVEWQAMRSTFNQGSSRAEWLLNNDGQWITTLDITAQGQEKPHRKSKDQIAFRLVRENNP
jgi:hypothetical protein